MTGFTDLELKLLSATAEHFSSPERIKTLTLTVNTVDGFENWFQVEIIRALNERGIKATVWGKKDYDADIVVTQDNKKIGVELRCWKANFSGDPVDSVLKDHPNADLYLFLAQNGEGSDKIIRKFRENKLEVEMRRLNSDWVIIIGKNLLS